MVFEIVKCAALGDQRNEQNSCCNYRVRLFFLFYFFFFIFRLRIRQWKKAFVFQKKNIRDTRKRGSDTAIVMPIVRRVYLSYFWRPARPIFTVSFSFLIITPSGRRPFFFFHLCRWIRDERPALAYPTRCGITFVIRQVRLGVYFLGWNQIDRHFSIFFSLR